MISKPFIIETIRVRRRRRRKGRKRRTCGELLLQLVEAEVAHHSQTSEGGRVRNKHDLQQHARVFELWYSIPPFSKVRRTLPLYLLKFTMFPFRSGEL